MLPYVFLSNVCLRCKYSSRQSKTALGKICSPLKSSIEKNSKRSDVEMAGTLNRNFAIAALVLGITEIVFGLIIMICSFVLGGKLGNASTTLTPYWAGIPVS